MSQEERVIQYAKICIACVVTGGMVAFALKVISLLEIIANK